MLKIKQKWDSIPLEVKVSTSYTVCSIIQKCISFITVPLFTELLTEEQYGQYTVYFSWSGILTIFLTLNLAYGSFSTAMVKFEDRRAEYINSIQGIVLTLSTAFMIIYLPFRSLWNKLFKMPTFLVILMVSEILFYNSTMLWMGRNRFELKYKAVVGITLLSSFLSPILAYVLVSMTEEKGYARTFGYACTNIVIGIVLFIINFTKGKKLYNKEFWKYAFSFNIPLIVYYLSQVIFNQSDNIMIDHITGTADAALYGFAYNIAMILTFVLNAINGSYVPWMYNKIKKGEGRDNRSVSVILAVLMALMILCIIWYAPEITMLMTHGKYMASIYVIAPVAISLELLFFSQLFINVEFYYEEKKLLVYGSIGAAVINVVLNYLLIPIYGFVAAGYTTLFSYIVFAVCNYFNMRKVLKDRNIPDDMYDYKALIIIFLFFVASSYLGVALYGNLIVRIGITITVLGIMIIFKNKFLNVLKMIKEG